MVRRQGATMPRASQGSLRIGLISDTHESADPQALVARLQRLQADLNVHLGDIGGARCVMDAVREFKRSMGSLERLTERQRQEYARLIEQGLPPMRAYGEAVLGAQQSDREQRRLETQQSYVSTLSALSVLRNVYCLAGNVDNLLLRAGVISDQNGEHAVTLVTRPVWLDCDDSAVVFWPSMRVRDDQDGDRLRGTVAAFVDRAQTKRRVVVLGHEQLFKGPLPRVYKARVQAKGLDAVTIPWFEPSPTWRYLMTLFRMLPPEVETAYIFGHMHDGQEVVNAGMPHLKRPHGLQYRLYGLGHVVSPADRGREGRRCLPMFYVPSERVGVLTLGNEGLKWEVLAL